jgi:hypothetical protein
MAVSRDRRKPGGGVFNDGVPPMDRTTCVREAALEGVMSEAPDEDVHWGSGGHEGSLAAAPLLLLTSPPESPYFLPPSLVAPAGNRRRYG